MSGLISKAQLESRKIVYYPELGYMLKRYWDENSVRTDEWVDSAINHHLYRIKLLSLYFDHILIPFGHFVTPINGKSLQLYRALLSNNEFAALAKCEIVIGSTWGGTTIEEELLAHTDFLKQYSWDYYVLLSNTIKDTLSELTVFHRNVTNQSQFMLDKANVLCDSNKDVLGNDFNLVKKWINEKSYKGIIPFIHESYARDLASSKVQKFRSFLMASNSEYFKSGEFGNPGAVIYYVFGEGDSVNRVTSTGIYAIFYSPEVFESILGFYLEDGKLENIRNVSADSLALFRNTPDFREAIDFYHLALKNASEETYFKNTQPENVEKYAEKILGNLQAIGDQDSYADIGLTQLIHFVAGYLGGSSKLPENLRKRIQKGARKYGSAFTNKRFSWWLKHIDELTHKTGKSLTSASSRR